MIEIVKHSKICESVDDMPDFTSATDLYMDFETQNVTSEFFGTKKPAGMYPFKGDRICGIAITADEHPDSYYIPIRHRHGNNLPLQPVQRWLKDHVTKPKKWVNHNVNFDAMFAHFDKATFKCQLIDTLSLAKIHDSDRLGHGLKPLARDWLDMPMEEVDVIKQWLTQLKTKDYSAVPIDVMGQYACMDVISNRKLYKYLCKNKAEGIEGIWETERKLAEVLFDMELEGMRINPSQCRKEAMNCLTTMISHAQEIEEISGHEWTNSSQCIYSILCGTYGLPVLATIHEKNEHGRKYDTGRPTFDKDAMALYEVHPQVIKDSKLTRLIILMREYSTESIHHGLFCEPFVKLADVNNRIHPVYNPIVRTGRMSCSRPNIQQQNKRSKGLLLCDPGRGFISNDYSQIEYRFIVDYMNDIDAIRAYNEDPNTDFHQLVADMIGVERDAGKTLNFGMAYGAGKKLVTKNLAANPNIIAEIGKQIAEMDLPDAAKTMMFNELCQRKAEQVYDMYHERLPGIKTVARTAMQVAKRRGYVRNRFGRRRHLPVRFSYKAFNSVVQGGAMDLMKEAMIKMSPRFNEEMRDIDLRLVANVHDEILSSVPLEVLEDPALHVKIKFLLEHPSVEFKIPILTDLAISTESWASCKGLAA